MISDMAVPMPIMEFVQRFQALQVQRDTGDELIKVCSFSFLFPLPEFRLFSFPRVAAEFQRFVHCGEWNGMLISCVCGVGSFDLL